MTRVILISVFVHTSSELCLSNARPLFSSILVQPAFSFFESCLPDSPSILPQALFRTNGNLNNSLAEQNSTGFSVTNHTLAHDADMVTASIYGLRRDVKGGRRESRVKLTQHVVARVLVHRVWVVGD